MKLYKLILFMFFLICLSCQNQTDVEESDEVEDPIEIEDPIIIGTWDWNGLPGCRCNSYKVENPIATAIEDMEPTYLAGTKWKLVGFIKTERGDTVALKPIDCEYCYTLTFYTDYTARSFAINDWSFKLDLRPASINRCPSISCIQELEIVIYEKDGNEYHIDAFERCFIRIESYTATNDELIFYYYDPFQKRDEGYYTLFKRIDK